MAIVSQSLSFSFPALQPRVDWPTLPVAYRLAGLLLLLLLTVVAGSAQVSGDPGDKSAQELNGVINGNAYGFGKSIKINGTVTEGAIAFGGDVIVQGTVDGDVAAIGGSVIQLPGSRIGGDVLVLGGTYHHADQTPNRNPSSFTIMYAGYQEELRNMMRNPTGLLAPRWSSTYVGTRLLSILFWFVVSVALTAAMPGAVSRGIARLQLTSLRVAVIGVLGAIVVGVGVEACLFLLPTPFSVLVGMMVLLFIIIAGVFGRVVFYAATGRWLQRRYPSLGRNSESVALLLGTVIWVTLSSLPYVWPFFVAVVLVLSFGLALTAGRRSVWKKMPVTNL
jgi:hypothetical protein